MILLIFGDSITQGYWDKEGGWADRLRASVFARDIDESYAYYHGVHNLGVDGNITAQVLERFESESEARFWPNSEYGVVFAIGVNDTVSYTDGRTISSPSQYEQELSQLVHKARLFAKNIAFVNLCPVDESLTNPLPASTTGKCYTNARIDAFNDVLGSVAKSEGVTLVDVNSLFANKHDLLADGLHPNSAGHKIIYEAVMSEVKNWLF